MANIARAYQHESCMRCWGFVECESEIVLKCVRLMPNAYNLVARSNFLLQVLGSLRPWELRNPDIAAAVEVRR